MSIHNHPTAAPARASRFALVEYPYPATPDELFDVVDEEAVGGDGDVVRLQNGAELAGLFEIE